MSDDTLSFFVAGEAVPQGSAKGFVVKGRAIITHANKGTEGWRQRIAHEAQAALNGRNMIDPDASYVVIATFFFPLPKSKTSKKWWYEHTTRPDLDKLIRALNDALTGIVWKDDSQVRSIVIGKDYAAQGQAPGVHVKVVRHPGRHAL